MIRGPQNDNSNPAHTAARAGALGQQRRSELWEQEPFPAALGPGPHWPHSSLCPHSPSENGHFIPFTPFTWVHPLTVRPGSLPWVPTTLVPLSWASKHLTANSSSAPHLLIDYFIPLPSRCRDSSNTENRVRHGRDCSSKPLTLPGRRSSVASQAPLDLPVNEPQRQKGKLMLIFPGTQCERALSNDTQPGRGWGFWNCLMVKETSIPGFWLLPHCVLP